MADPALKSDRPVRRDGPLSRRSLLRLALWILAVLLPLALAAGGLLSSASTTLARFLHDRTQRAAVETVEALDRFVSERSGDLLTVSGLPLVKTLDRPRLADILDRMVATRPFYRLALVADWQGRILAVNRVDGAGHPLPSAPLLDRSVAQEAWFAETVQAAQPVRAEDFHVDPLLQALASDEQPVISLSAPIVNDEYSVVGVLSVRLTAEPLREILTRRAQRNASPEPAALVLLNQRDQTLLATAGAAQPGVSVHATASAGGFLESAGLSWRVQAYGPAGRGAPPPPQRIWLGVGLGLLLAGAGIAWAVNRHLLQPMRRLTRPRREQPAPHDAPRGQGGKPAAPPANDRTVSELEVLMQARTRELKEVREELQKETTARTRAEETLRKVLAETAPGEKAQSEGEPRAPKRALDLAQTSEALQAETAERQ